MDMDSEEDKKTDEAKHEGADEKKSTPSEGSQDGAKTEADPSEQPS